jgi:hypothetical protein
MLRYSFCCNSIIFSYAGLAFFVAILSINRIEKTTYFHWLSADRLCIFFRLLFHQQFSIYSTRGSSTRFNSTTIANSLASTMGSIHVTIKEHAPYVQPVKLTHLTWESDVPWPHIREAAMESDVGKSTWFLTIRSWSEGLGTTDPRTRIRRPTPSATHFSICRNKHDQKSKNRSGNTEWKTGIWIEQTRHHQNHYLNLHPHPTAKE